MPEFPGPSFRVKEEVKGKPLSGGGNYTLKAGMILSISPTLCDEATGDLLLGGIPDAMFGPVTAARSAGVQTTAVAGGNVRLSAVGSILGGDND